MNQNEVDGWGLPSKPPNPRGASYVESKLGAYFWEIARWWGMLFRMLFLAFIGFVGYVWIDPKDIGNIPFAELTLNDLLGRLFSALIILWCIYWFFSFPDQSEAESPRDNPYVLWAKFGGWVVAIALAAMYYLV